MAFLWVSCVGPDPFETPSGAFTKPEFEQDIAAFENLDIVEGLQEGGLLFVGSSSIRRWDTLEEDFGSIAPVIGRGFGGSQMSDLVLATERIVTPHQPRVIIVYAGDNDINQGKSPETVLRDFQTFCRLTLRKSPQSSIVFLSIKASPDRWDLRQPMRRANELVRDYCGSRRRLAYVDCFDVLLGADGLPNREFFVDDLLHLSPVGYEVWAENLRPVLASRVRQRP